MGKDYSPEAIEKRWTDIAKKQLVGKKIVSVRYMTNKEMDELGWYSKCVIMQLDDGNIVFPSQDDEGNNAGALFTNDKQDNVLPVIS